MASSKRGFNSVDDYFASFPENVRCILGEVRRAIREVVPEAEEIISYQMPAFKLKGILVWYAAYKNHIGFYPRVSAIVAFKDKLIRYKVSKGTVQFPVK